MRDGLGELTDAERELFEERAAVAEYDGGLPRPIAESEAKREIGWRRALNAKDDSDIALRLVPLRYQAASEVS